jgi:hypothetical protein
MLCQVYSYLMRKGGRKRRRKLDITTPCFAISDISTPNQNVVHIQECDKGLVRQGTPKQDFRHFKRTKK